MKLMNLNKPFYPSECNLIPFETDSEVDHRKNIEKPIVKPIEKSVDNLDCEYCDFKANNLAGLKIHIRRMHSLPQKLY